MVRSVAITAVVLGLAWTGLAGAQSSPSTAAPARERFITVHEEGKPAQRCKLLRTWREPNGSPAFQVQAVDTGELLTIVGSGPPGASSDPREMSTRIFRWGSDNKPPAGAPVPPPVAITKTMPRTQSAPSTPSAPRQVLAPTPPVSGVDPRQMSPAIVRQNSGAKPPTNAPLLPVRPTPITAAPVRSTPVRTQQALAPAPSVPARATPQVSPIIISQNNAATPSINAPLLPPSAKPMTVTPPQPAVARTTPAVAPPAISSASPSISAPLLPLSQPTPATLTSRKTEATPSSPFASPTSAQPALVPPAVTIGKPGAAPSIPSAGSTPQLLTPMSTPVIQQPLVHTPSMNDGTPSAPTQPRLLPSASGTIVSQTPSPCGCPTACNTGCQPCNQPCQACQPCETCNQPSCVGGTTSPMRQSFLSRLFKRNPTCECTEVVCEPAPPAPVAPTPAPAPVVAKPPAPAPAKVVTETAKPRDWRESWGKVEPWNAAAQAAPTAKPIEPRKVTAEASPPKPAEALTQRAAPPPVRLEPAAEPDPIKAPDMYRDLAMSTRFSSSKIPDESQPALPKKTGLFGLKRSIEVPAPVAPPPASVAATPNVASPMRAPGRAVQLPADEANAFWSPPEAPKVKYNTAEGEQDRPPASRVSPRIAPGYAGPLPPPGPMQPRLPMMPSRPDTGVPDAMGNAFTLPGTRRPIPADFGPTPQEPNGFDPAVQMGQGSPPQDYSMPAMPRPAMANMMAMGPRPPMMGNPFVNVPPTPAAPVAAAPPAGVPQLLATLKDSLYPSERESAAERLSELSGRPQPVVVQHLMKSARQDPAATVRAACVHALINMKAPPPEVTALARDLKSDRDPRVRQEAEEALHALGDSGIQQASHR